MHDFPPNRKVLFILKYRKLYQDILFDESEKNEPYSYFSSGLLNSARQVSDMLNDHGVESKVVQVLDNNSIDKEVYDYKPTDVIIEALWVVPEKFEILQKLHPKVRWIIRLHSETPFMANEGIAMDWILKYIKHKNVYVGLNSLRMREDLKAILPVVKEYKLLYLPNYYDLDKNNEHCHKVFVSDNTLDISCFGAIRPLKNQVLQAIAAIKYVKETGKNLRFHINGSRIENDGNNVYKNIKGLFEGLNDPRYQLVEHGWLDPKEFRKLIGQMDISMQVSLTETWNIVSGDATAQDIPIVVSEEVQWASWISKVPYPTDIDSIVDTMRRVDFFGSVGIFLNKRGLKASNKKTVHAWLQEFRS